MTLDEIDTLIAERVMHFKTDPEDAALWLAEGGMIYLKDEFSPSSDMRYAMMVVRHLLGSGFYGFNLNYHRGLWYATIGDYEECQSTPELAIVHAALKAKGVRLDEAK